MRTTNLVFIFATLIFLNACNSKEGKADYFEVKDDIVAKLEEPLAMEEVVKFTPPNIVSDYEVLELNESKAEAVVDKPIVSKKKIIKDGNISIKTNDVHSSKKGIDDLLKKLSAYYESEDLENNDQKISYNLKIRVPAYNFEKFILTIENGKDEIKSKSIQARDVTEEYVDIETRLTNKREYLKRYKQLLFKASTVKDILAIEENIRILEEEIESKEGRLKYLSDQVSFSTLNIDLYMEKEFIYKPQPQDKFSERVKTSLRNGWKSVVDFILWTITIWPYLILVLVGFFVIKRVIKKRKSKPSV